MKYNFCMKSSSLLRTAERNPSTIAATITTNDTHPCESDFFSTNQVACGIRIRAPVVDCDEDENPLLWPETLCYLSAIERDSE